MSSHTKTAGRTSAKMNVRTMVEIGMLGAISVILMMFEIPLWFAPSFYKIDLSECRPYRSLALGPVAGALIELVKILLHLLLKGTSTAGVGDLANFLIGCAMAVPAAWIYQKQKTKKNAIIGLVCGTAVMTIAGSFLNALVLLPAYAAAFGMPIDALVGMGTAVNKAITSVATFALFAVAPFNIVKGVLVSLITMLLYKHVSPILKGNR